MHKEVDEKVIRQRHHPAKGDQPRSLPVLFLMLVFFLGGKVRKEDLGHRRNQSDRHHHGARRQAVLRKIVNRNRITQNQAISGLNDPQRGVGQHYRPADGDIFSPQRQVSAAFPASKGRMFAHRKIRIAT